MNYLAIFVILTFSWASARGQSAQHPGPQADGSVLLHNQWSLRPAGRQIPLGSFPVDLAVHPGGRYAAALNAGYGAHEVDVIDLRDGVVIQREPISIGFYGIVFSADGHELFCSGAGDEVVHRFHFKDGKLLPEKDIRLRKKSLRGVPSGLAMDRAGRHLFAANLWSDSVSEISLRDPVQITDLPLDTNGLRPDISPVVPPQDFDTFAAEKRAELGLYNNDSTRIFPYACRLDERRHRLYVSLWGAQAVAVVDLKSGQVTAHWPAGDHPCEMALSRSGKLLYVADANLNTVTVLDTATGQPRERIWAALVPDALPGSTPNSLALSPDEKTLYVANANIDAIAVFDIGTPGKSRSLGFIPTGWYPTSVRVTPDGQKLLVLSGKGISPKANPRGPQPGQKTSQYIGYLYKGTLAIIDLPKRAERETRMAAWTADVYRCSPPRGANSSRAEAAASPVPVRMGDPSPIRYCIYIIKENRTYDQILGDLPQGNGDPKLCLFPERVTPNLHKIARQFVLLDNTYCDAEVSASGHEWSMAAYCSDFVEKTWPIEYGHGHDGKFPYPSEGHFPIATPASGYIWDRAREAGISYRSYGEFVDNPRRHQPAVARRPALVGHIDPEFCGFDLSYSDLDRAARFISEFKRLEAAGQMPGLQIVRIPNDHTHGVTPGSPTPTSYMAENDLAVGRIVEAVSHSSLWAQTAIFIIEDDAQNGPDHVDAHRTTAYVVSPYTLHGKTDSTMYSTCGLLHTMELILGLQPMSQFDAAATPMRNAFQGEPDLTPFDAVPSNVDLRDHNKSTAWGAGVKMNFAREDQADDLLLNEMIWKSVRGASSPMPAPIHAAFIMTRKGDDDDD